MGVYPTKPILEHNQKLFESKEYIAAYSQVQGWKLKQDDILLFIPDFEENIQLYAVIDCHGGQEFGNLLKEKFPSILKEQKDYKNQKYKQALISAFEQADQDLKNENFDYQGATLLVCLVTEEEIYAANAGISRCIVYQNGRHRVMTVDHYPTNETEKQRVIKAGGDIWENRVNAHLPFTRGLGDYQYKNMQELGVNKQIIISTPEVKWVPKEGTDIILIGSDGFWQNWTNSGIASSIMERIQNGKPILNILDDLIDSIVASDLESEFGLDNISCMLIQYTNKDK